MATTISDHRLAVLGRQAAHRPDDPSAPEHAPTPAAPETERWDWRFDDRAGGDALIDDRLPRPAFVWNAWLGAGLDKRVDRAAARPLVSVRHWAIAHREFLDRVVEDLVARGIRQYVDLGCGAPSAGHAAQVITSVLPDARVVGVDLDLLAVELTRRHYRNNPRVTAFEGDLRRIDLLLNNTRFLHRIDLAEPVAWLAVAVLQHLTDTDAPARLLARLREACVAGSYLAISHPAPAPAAPPDVTAALAAFPAPWVARDPAGAAGLLGGWRPVDPGVVPITATHAVPDALPVPAWAVLAEAAPPAPV